MIMKGVTQSSKKGIENHAQGMFTATHLAQLSRPLSQLKAASTLQQLLLHSRPHAVMP
jgi:hypothetical protein